MKFGEWRRRTDREGTRMNRAKNEIGWVVEEWVVEESGW